MKILDVPQSGKRGLVVAFQSRFGLCLREWVVPRNTITPARQQRRTAFGNNSQMWGGKLTQAQRDRWNLAGPQVMSHPRLAQRGPLTGQQFWQAVGCIRATVGLPVSLEPPAPVVFARSGVGRLVIENSPDGVRMWLAVSGELNEDIMVFGQEPCSAGRQKRRNTSYLGLLPPPIGGLSEITPLYKARFGEPGPGRKVFIVTCQHKNGWKGLEQETCEIVPNRSEGLQATSQPENSQNPYMHKGSTRDAEGTIAPVGGQCPGGAETVIEGGKAAGAAIGGGGEGKT